MSAFLVLDRWNGMIHASVVHDDVKSRHPKLATEIVRIELGSIENVIPIDMLRAKYAKERT